MRTRLAEDRKLTDEIVRCMPDENRYPRAAVDAVRSFLMLRLGLHLGLRQKNLRQLLVCATYQRPSTTLPVVSALNMFEQTTH
jgi:hypothetical protein